MRVSQYESQTIFFCQVIIKCNLSHMPVWGRRNSQEKSVLASRLPIYGQSLQSNTFLSCCIMYLSVEPSNIVDDNKVIKKKLSNLRTPPRRVVITTSYPAKLDQHCGDNQHIECFDIVCRLTIKMHSCIQWVRSF